MREEIISPKKKNEILNLVINRQQKKKQKAQHIHMLT